jgi:hypothetical protein
MLPREPLTKKARAAIEQWVILAGRRYGHYLPVLLKACLAAERMRRADLYAALEKKGYAWKPRNGFWAETKKQIEPGERVDK